MMYLYSLFKYIYSGWTQLSCCPLNVSLLHLKLRLLTKTDAMFSYIVCGASYILFFTIIGAITYIYSSLINYSCLELYVLRQ